MTPVSPREAPGVSQGNVVQNPKMLRDWPEALKIHATGTPPRWRLKGWERQWRGAAARGLPAAGTSGTFAGREARGAAALQGGGVGGFRRGAPPPGPALGRLACRGEGETLTTARCTHVPQARRASLGNQTSSQVCAQETGAHGSVPSGVPRARGFGEQVPLRHVHDPEAKAQSAWSCGSAAGRGRGPRSAPTWSRTPRGGAPDGEGAWDPREADAQASVTGHGGEART